MSSWYSVVDFWVRQQKGRGVFISLPFQLTLELKQYIIFVFSCLQYPWDIIKKAHSVGLMNLHISPKYGM